MNNLFNKTVAICKVFFCISNSVEKLPEYEPKYSGRLVLKIHPKGHYMQIRKYRNDGHPEYDIDLHDHNEEKEYTHGGIHIHEFKWQYIKKLNANKYVRLNGRNLTDEEYDFLQNINHKDLIQIQVRYE